MEEPKISLSYNPINIPLCDVMYLTHSLNMPESSSHLNIKLNILWGYSIILVKDTFCPPLKGAINFIIGPFFKQDIRPVTYIYYMHKNPYLIRNFYFIRFIGSLFEEQANICGQNRPSQTDRTGRALQLQIPWLSLSFSFVPETTFTYCIDWRRRLDERTFLNIHERIIWMQFLQWCYVTISESNNNNSLVFMFSFPDTNRMSKSPSPSIPLSPVQSLKGKLLVVNLLKQLTEHVEGIMLAWRGLEKGLTVVF